MKLHKKIQYWLRKHLRISYDSRWWSWWLQRREHGFDERETWCLYLSMAEWLLPRMQMLQHQMTDRMSWGDMSQQECNQILIEIVAAFEIIVKSKGGLITPEQQPIIDRGLDQFRKHFFALWW